MNSSYIKKSILCNEDILHAAVAEWKTNHKDTYYEINQQRQLTSLALADTRMYSLRYAPLPNNVSVVHENTCDILTCLPNSLAHRFPKLFDLVINIGYVVNHDVGWSKLGRMFVTCLDALSCIEPHIDTGLYYDKFRRFHVPLEADGLAEFHWQGSHICMRVGEVWELNNSITHWVNNSGGPRTHLIFDAI